MNVSNSIIDAKYKRKCGNVFTYVIGLYSLHDMYYAIDCIIVFNAARVLIPFDLSKYSALSKYPRFSRLKISKPTRIFENIETLKISREIPRLSRILRLSRFSRLPRLLSAPKLSRLSSKLYQDFQKYPNSKNLQAFENYQDYQGFQEF